MSANSSPLSSPPSSDDDLPLSLPRLSPSAHSTTSGLSTAPESRSMSPKKKQQREPEPPHEDVLADDPAIAFIIMFRARFSDAFPPKLANFGPQDIERGVVEGLPSPQVESLLCALLGLVLNRKKPVERGHYGRALEDALSSQRPQWPREWNNINPISGGKNFNNMSPTQRLSLLRALIMWSLHCSDAISHIIKESYKQSRQDDDLNQPLSVQPWGRDGDKRRYWLVEGRDDTSFRLYRESNPALKTHTWWSMAGSIDELKVVSQKLEQESSQISRRLGQRITNALPRFLATEEVRLILCVGLPLTRKKRKRREYRVQRKMQFVRPEPGFSLYEGRTRGKRMKYTYSDEELEEENFSSDVQDRRRSTRGMAQPAVESVTASGRRVRPPHRNLASSVGASMDNSTAFASPATDNYERSDVSEEMQAVNGRATRAAGRRARNGWESHNEIDVMDSEEQLQDDYNSVSSGEEWEGEDEMDDQVDDEDEEMTEASDDEVERPTLVVKLRYNAGAKMPFGATYGTAAPVQKPDVATGILAQNLILNSKDMATEARPSQSPTEVPAAFITPSTNGTTPTKTEPNGPGYHQENAIPSFSKYLYRPPTPEAQQVLSDRSKLENFSPTAVGPKPPPEKLDPHNQSTAFHHQSPPQRAAFSAG